MQSPAVAGEIISDARAAKKLGMRGIPFIFLNNRRVYQWRKTIETLVEVASQEPGPPG